MTEIPPSNSAAPSKSLYAGLFVLTLATLLLELALTRIFSVIMYYHMAFFAVSVTLLGISVGAVVVHFLPRVFTPSRASGSLSALSLAFAVSTVYALYALLARKIWIGETSSVVRNVMRLSLVLGPPFIFSGMAIAISLTRFPKRTNLLYGFDLAGSAMGCLLFAPLIYLLGGPGLILLVAALGAIAGLVFIVGLRTSTWRYLGIVVIATSTMMFAIFIPQSDDIPAFQIKYSHGYDFHPDKLTYDKWNSLSRITASPHQGPADGVAMELREKSHEEMQMMLIDTFAATPVIKSGGQDFAAHYFPFHDISFGVHAIRKDAKVAIIGVGGGRDILAAKAWGQPDIVGLEINSRILEAFTKKFAEFAGNPLAWKGVRIVRDEARSFLTRTDEKFDIIQASLIDTYAATSAGAFVLTENSLYTMEGWKIFLDQLTDNGILTMTRWHAREQPVESLRLLALARAALEARGAKRPQDHFLMAAMKPEDHPEGQPMATLMVKKSPYHDDEIAAFETWCRENFFLPLITPKSITDPQLAAILEAPNLAQYADSHTFDLSPPTDDRPFFFDMLRWRNVGKREYRSGAGHLYNINFKPLVMLAVTLGVLGILAFILIVVPLGIEQWMTRAQTSRTSLPNQLGAIVYFIMLGLAYMLIELTLIQRFTIFLGHPSYSLAVCLFSMLLFSGLGSMLAQRIVGVRRLLLLNALLPILLAVTWFGAQWSWSSLIAAPTVIRILLAAALITPAAFFMGMPMPLGLQRAAQNPAAPLSWYWGLNGAFSVVASVLAIALAHAIGLRATFMLGAGCYLIAALVANTLNRSDSRPS